MDKAAAAVAAARAAGHVQVTCGVLASPIDRLHQLPGTNRDDQAYLTESQRENPTPAWAPSGARDLRARATTGEH